VTVVGVTMVKDERDIVFHTLEHMLDQVDFLVIADNGSTDGTREELHEFYDGGRVLVVDDDEPGYYQSQKMTHLANVAMREFGADWIVPFDADEWWYSPFGRIGDELEKVAAQWLVVPAAVYDHMVTGEDVDHTNPYLRMTWRRQKPLDLPKVACRWREDLIIEQGNHGASYTGRATVFDPLLVVRHFPYRSLEQFIRKVRNGAAAYAAAGERLPLSMGTHWRQWGELSDEELEGVFKTWYTRPNPLQTYVGDEDEGYVIDPLIHDPVSAL
jgi:hypothetical protein